MERKGAERKSDTKRQRENRTRNEKKERKESGLVTQMLVSQIPMGMSDGGKDIGLYVQWGNANLEGSIFQNALSKDPK